MLLDEEPRHGRQSGDRAHRHPRRAIGGRTGGADGAGFGLRGLLDPDDQWHISDRWSLGVGGSWTSWSWSDKDRRYALWEVAPEVRYYMGAQRRGYLGVLFKAGAFNYKLSETGRQGDILGGGLTGGYILG